MAKPELVFIKENDGMVTMSKEDLERLFDKAYEAGKSDGCGVITLPTPYITNPNPTTPITTWVSCGTDTAERMGGSD